MKNFFPKFFLIISSLILSYVLYRSEIVWNGLNRNYYYPYYIFSIIFFIFSIVSFFLNKKIKLYLGIISISFVTALYLFEFFYINLKKTKINPDNISEYETKTGKKYDTRSKLQFYKDKKKNEEIFVTVNPVSFIQSDIKNKKIFKLSGISNSKTINCNENGYYSIYLSDRYGFNNPDEMWDSKEIEYMVVGDSFTQGQCVNRPHDIPSVLRSLSKGAVLNLGYGGNGPLIEYAVLREYIQPNVKNILWIYYENDLQDLKKEIQSPILSKYLENLSFSQNLKDKQDLIDEINKNIISHYFKYSFHIINFIKLYDTRETIRYYFSNKKKINLSEKIKNNYDDNNFKFFEKILLNSKNLAKKNNSNFYFIYLPNPRLVYNYRMGKMNKEYLTIKKIIKKLNINSIYLEDELSNIIDDPMKLIPFKNSGHYTVSGYKIISELIYKKIKESN